MNYQLIEASNVKEGNGLSGFQDRRLQPLGHPSKKRTNYNESPLRAQGPGLSIITF